MNAYVYGVVVLATFSLNTGVFPFDRLLERTPDVTIELERVVPVGGATVPYFWVSGVNGADLERLTEPDESGSDMTVVTEAADQSLVRITWATGSNRLFDLVEASGVTLLSAVGTADGWHLEVRAEEHSPVSRFHTLCADAGIPADLVELNTLTPSHHPAGVELTEPQIDALVLAYDRGYYDQPRRATLSDLAEELDISRQAVSARLKRGIRQLIEQTLVA